jgi:hypothetical protein
LTKEIIGLLSDRKMSRGSGFSIKIEVPSFSKYSLSKFEGIIGLVSLIV